MRKKLTDLQASIDENDNNYVMIAKLNHKHHEQTVISDPVTGTPVGNRM